MEHKQLRKLNCGLFATGEGHDSHVWLFDSKSAGHAKSTVEYTCSGLKTAKVILFEDSGKYHTQEQWRIPEDARGPYDMVNSPDFRRVESGAVLVESQEPWGYPCLFNPVGSTQSKGVRDA